MSKNKPVPEMRADEFEQILREHATPIDFDGLIESGVIEKRGAWYKILNMADLPRHALKQAREAKQDKDGKPLLKFPSSTKKAEKMLREFEARKRG